MKKKRIICIFCGLFFALFLVHLFAGTFDCQISGSSGSVDGVIINMGTILWADGDSGKKTTILLPMNYTHGSSSISKNDLPTPSGNFVIKLTVRLAGRKSWGIWTSKRNVVTVEVREDMGTGTILQQATLDKNVSSPTNYTFQVPQVTVNLSSGNSKHYAIMIQFDKYDGDGGNDGRCGEEVNVRAE